MKGWQQMVQDAGEKAWQQTDGPRAQARLDALLAGLKADPTALGDVSDWVNDLVTQLMDTCTLPGYCLAKTWPTGPEGLPDWPMQALRYAGLEVARPADGEEATR